MSRLLQQPFILLCLLGLFFVFVMSPAVQAENGPTKVTLATATKGGGFQLFGSHLAEVINSVDASLQVETIATKGSKQNLSYLEQGKVDIGQVEGNAARQALDGIGREKSNLKVLSVMYPNPGAFVVRGDSTYESIEDLKGQAIAFGTQASGLRILANDVLNGLDLDPDSDFEQVILNKAAEGPRLVLDKKVEALWGAGIGWPGFVEVSNGPSGGRLIAPTAAQIEKILIKHPHLKIMSVPAGTYHGQEKQIDSVGLWSLILVKSELPDDVVYRLARAIHKGEAAMATRLKQGDFTRAQNTVKHVPIKQMHPAAARYYSDAGLMK